MDVDKILISKKESNKTHKCFIGHNYNDEIKPLFIKLPQMIGYFKCFNNNNNNNDNNNTCHYMSLPVHVSL